MDWRWSALCVSLALSCVACSADPQKTGRGQQNDAANSGNNGGSGGDTSASGSDAMDFGNPPPVNDAGMVDLDALQKERADNPNCSPGKYVGTYNCTLEMNGMMSLPLQGNVSFDLSATQSKMQECTDNNEFCYDLVIDKGSGKLFGFALLFIGFETSLEGGLDCKTGTFHAKAVDGIWGLPVSSNPNDPMAPLMVSKPPSGTFDGEMMGVHLGGDPQKIEGMWSLHEIMMNLTCPGPFTVQRQP